MKILYHHRTLGDGAEGIHVAAMVDAFRALGHDVEVTALIGEKTNVSTPRTRALGTVTKRLPRPAYELMELGYSAVGYRWLNGQIRRWSPDFVYERYTLFNLAGVGAARRSQVPLVLEVNAPLAHERAAFERLALKRLARRCEAYVCANADHVIVVSTPLKEYLVDIGVVEQRITVLPNGVDTERFKPDAAARTAVRAQLGIPEDAVVAGFCGILRPWHGIDLLLEAARGIPDLHVLIVGDGPSRPDLEKLTQELKLPHVTITGRVAHDRIPAYLNAFDIGVSPRATFYASPMKIPEYMATGAAVIGPRMANIADLVDDGITGLLVKPESVDALHDGLQTLVEDAEYRRALGRRGRAHVARARTWEANAREVLQRVAAA
jgi:glycosyltransferase involved in cell wall biosynthesis